MKDFRRLFLKGLAALMPTVVTIAVLVWAFNWINDRVATGRDVDRQPVLGIGRSPPRTR